METSDLQKLSSQTAMLEEKGTRREIIKTCLLVVLLTGGLAFVRYSPLWYYLDPTRISLLQDRLTGFESLAPFIFLAGGSLLIAIGVPRTIFSILGGVVFGFLAGTLLATAAAFAGSLMIFWLTRLLGRPLFRQKIGHRLKNIEDHLENNGFLVVIILRQLPLPSLLINVMIALSSINTGGFILGSVIGLLPEAAIFALFGSSVRDGFVLRVSVASFLLILLVLFVRFYYRRSPLARELVQRLTSDKV